MSTTVKCPGCKQVPDACTCPKNDNPNQRRIMAAIWLLKQSIKSWLNVESDEHPEGCDCFWCNDLDHLEYMVSLQESRLEGNMVGPPDGDEACLMLLGYLGMLARIRGLGEYPVVVPAPSTADPPTILPFPTPSAAAPVRNARRKGWFFEFGFSSGNAS